MYESPIPKEMNVKKIFMQKMSLLFSQKEVNMCILEYKIIEMGHWISEHEITTTPNYLVNGKMMPEIYGVEDILAMVANL